MDDAFPNNLVNHELTRILGKRPLAGLTGDSLAGNSAQTMIDQVVGECIVYEGSGEFHGPEVETGIPPGGPLPADPALFHIGTPVGSAPVPMEHDLVLPPSTLQQRESPRTPDVEEPKAKFLNEGDGTDSGTISHGSGRSLLPQRLGHGLPRNNP